MRPELEDILVKQFPHLFKDYKGDPTKTCMTWGFDCGDGWFKIIYKLAEKLSKYDIVALQVKEKFGGLRFYIDGTPPELFDEIHGQIHEAEEQSFKTCETCGQPGERKNVGWIHTLCQQCSDLYDQGKTPWRNPEAFPDVAKEIFGNDYEELPNLTQDELTKKLEQTSL